ncbi:hypothetical protein OHB26_31245 [Nocardia sp. NBC_01503]|uniref:hypothetical protein n=1 Tax=Nocardia sp. NBC_01503 TaxID=2975997 RepID=UPI002E7AB6F6|nr:hypothetical protein [Nocardia sp. NBC_01503]WTL31351.1 hypothetical protein OHB26_31245 [Nocardia sp. NBC_01503]
MSDLVTRAQITLLSRTLHVPVERLAHLEKLGPQHLHDMQEAMAKVIFAQHNQTFARLSMLVPIIPLSISLPLVQRMVPPLIAGRAAGAIGVDHPRKAAEAVGMLEPAYAADGAPYMDPHAVGQLADVAPPEPVVAIVNEMLRRRDYVTAGPFLAYATPALIEAVEKGTHDDEGLIRSAAYAYSGTSISAVVRHLLHGAQQRVPRLARTIFEGSDELKLAAVSVFARCDADVIVGVGDILFEEGSSQDIGELVRAFITAGVLAETLRFVGQLSPSALDQLAVNPVVTEPESIDALTAAGNGSADAAIWRGLLELAERTESPVARRIGGNISHFDSAVLARLPEMLDDAHLWPPLLRVLAVAEPDAQSRIGEVWSALAEPDRRRLEERITELGLDEQLSALAATLRIAH